MSSGIARPDPLILAFDGASVGPTLPARNYGRIGLSLSVCGMGRPELPPLVPDFAHSDSSLSLRSSFCLGLILSLLDEARIDSFLPPRSLAQMGLAFPAFGMARAGSSALTFDVAHAGSSLPARSFGRTGLAMLVFGLVCLEPAAFAFDMNVFGPFIPVRSRAQPGSAVPLFASLRPDFTLSLADMTTMGSVLPVRSRCQPGFMLSTFSSVRFGPALPALDFVNLGSTSSVGTIRSARAGFSDLRFHGSSFPG